MAKRTATTPTIAAEICFFGTHEHGAGFLARTAAGKMLGTGDLVKGRTFTEALNVAAEELRTAGIASGTARVFEPTGKRCADIELGSRAVNNFWFGDLPWKDAPVFEISVEALMAAAEEPR